MWKETVLILGYWKGRGGALSCRIYKRNVHARHATGPPTTQLWETGQQNILQMHILLTQAPFSA